MAQLARVPGLTIHGPTGDDAVAQKVGVVPFTLDGFASGYVAAVLGHEHGIGVRSGCFCAQPYVAQLLSIQPTAMLGAAATGGVDGMVRISLGGYSDTGDVDRVVDAVQRVAAGAVRSPYRRELDGSWVPGSARRTPEGADGPPARSAPPRPPRVAPVTEARGRWVPEPPRPMRRVRSSPT
jgi:hypothetical protein